MKILALLRYSRRGPSSRVRFYQYFPYLEQQKVEISCHALFDDSDIVRRHAAGAPLAHRVVKSYLQRLFRLLSAKSFDLLWIEGELFPWLPGWIEGLLRPASIPYVVDYDDALFHRYDLHPSGLVRLALRRKIDRIMANAELVIVGNEYLRRHALSAGAGRVEVLPSVVEPDRYLAPPEELDHPFTIGWIGSPTTTPYLDLAAPALAALCADGKCRVVLVGPGKGVPANLPATRLPWSEDTEVGILQSFDVGIAPLLDEPWALGKCAYKIVQYMACAKPVVASPVGMNAEIVRHGENGLLAETEAEWIQAIESLRDDPDLRLRIGTAGRRLVSEQYSLHMTAPKLLALLEQAADR